MIRGLLYWVLGCIITFLWSFVAFGGYFVSRRGQEFLLKNIQIWSRFLLRFLCGVRFEVEGLEFIEKDRAYIIISNHRSYTDILVGNGFSPIQFRWLAKKSLFRIPIIGLAMRFAGYVPIVRERAMSASRALDRTAEVLKEGVSVWIFPEGTRTPEDKLRRFKRGAFELCRETGAPLLPVVLVNTDRIFETPLVIRPQRVKVVVLKPVTFSDFKKGGVGEREAVAQLMEAVRDTMQGTYDARVSRT
jgi:1-acyl-sn-glycerol-3-phosphate acyltransferase